MAKSELLEWPKKDEPHAVRLDDDFEVEIKSFWKMDFLRSEEPAKEAGLLGSPPSFRSSSSRPPPLFLTQDELKRIAAYKAVVYVQSGMVLGLGTCSTTRNSVDRIAELLRQGKLSGIVGVPTSTQTHQQALSLGIPLSDLDSIDWTYNYGVSSSDVGTGLGHFAFPIQDGNKMVAPKFLNTKIPEKINDVMASVPETSSVQPRWILDSGATHHGCKDKSLMMEFREADPNMREVQMATHDTAEIKGQGSVELDLPSGEKIKLENVLYVPELSDNLISVGLLDEMGLQVTFGNRKGVLSQNYELVGVAYRKDGLYELELN